MLCGCSGLCVLCFHCFVFCFVFLFLFCFFWAGSPLAVQLHSFSSFSQFSNIVNYTKTKSKIQKNQYVQRNSKISKTTKNIHFLLMFTKFQNCQKYIFQYSRKKNNQFLIFFKICKQHKKTQKLKLQ